MNDEEPVYENTVMENMEMALIEELEMEYVTEQSMDISQQIDWSVEEQ